MELVGSGCGYCVGCMDTVEYREDKEMNWLLIVVGAIVFIAAVLSVAACILGGQSDKRGPKLPYRRGR